MISRIRINATFNGNNSLGYIKSHQYDLKMVYRGGSLIIYCDRANACEYTSWKSFIRNWRINKIESDMEHYGIEYFPDNIMSHVLSHSRNLKLKKIKTI